MLHIASFHFQHIYLKHNFLVGWNLPLLGPQLVATWTFAGQAAYSSLQETQYFRLFYLVGIIIIFLGLKRY